MSESANVTVGEASVNDLFKAMLDKFRTEAFNSDHSQLGRIVEFVNAVAPLAKAWDAGLPASGKVPGRRGRPAGSTNGSGAAAEASTVAGADAAVTETQVETDPAPTGRSRSRVNA